MVPAARSRQVGDVCKSKMAFNNESDETVLGNAGPVIELSSSFYHRGSFTFFCQTFDIVEERHFAVGSSLRRTSLFLRTRNGSSGLTHHSRCFPELVLSSNAKSECHFEDKFNSFGIAVEGMVYVRDQLDALNPAAPLTTAKGTL